jgi:hypothetical protein
LSERLYREALQLVREAIDIPHARTLGDEEIRGQILDRRLMDTPVFLRAFLEDLDDEARFEQFGEWHLNYLRERLAGNPATGYRTWHDDRSAGHARTAGDAS